MYRFYVNDTYEFELAENDLRHDIKEYEQGRFHVLLNDKSYRAELVHADTAAKTLTIKVNGNTYDIQAEDKYDRLLKKLGFSNLNSQKIDNIKAPMPGLVLKIPIEAGQEIAKGDILLILEAMKMENAIKSPGNGKIKHIKVKEGDAVDKGQVLIELE